MRKIFSLFLATMFLFCGTGFVLNSQSGQVPNSTTYAYAGISDLSISGATTLGETV